MTADQFRQVRDAIPFRPFNIRLVDGRTIYIPHRDFVSLSPGGRTIVYHAPIGDAFSFVDLYLVIELEVLPLANLGEGAAGTKPEEVV